MKILIDTHIALWMLSDDPQLSREARDILLDEANDLYYSEASIWEITIKHMSHPDELKYSGQFIAERCADSGFQYLPILLQHIYQLESLVYSKGKPRHNDPFDRILIAQAKTEGMIFITHDSLIPNYNESCVISV